MIHGFKCYLLQDEKGEPSPVYSVASGLDYPGVGPEHSMLKDWKRVSYETATDDETINAFYELSRLEGIIRHWKVHMLLLMRSSWPNKTRENRSLLTSADVVIKMSIM